MPNNNITMSSLDFELYCRKIHDSFVSPRQLIPSLVSLTQTERQQLREKYRVVYGEDLMSCVRRYEAEVLNSSNALSMWMLDPHERDAMVVREALEEADTNYKAIVEIFVGRKSSHIILIKQAYLRRFRRQMEQDVISLELAHPFQKILMALAAAHKAHDKDVNQQIAKLDARRLYETGEGGSVAIEETVVLEILSKRSIPQLKLTFSSYEHIYGHDYTKALLRGNYGEFEKAMKLVVKCICNPSNYYAKALHRGIKGVTSDKGSLARVLVSRADVDLDEILRVFKHKYGKEVADIMCERFPSGDWRDFLVAIVKRESK